MKKVTVSGPLYSHLNGRASAPALSAGHNSLSKKPMAGTAEFNNEKAARDQKISGVGIGRSGGSKPGKGYIK